MVVDFYSNFLVSIVLVQLRKSLGPTALLPHYNNYHFSIVATVATTMAPNPKDATILFCIRRLSDK